ncbi:MAG: hypothetical protein ACETWM_08315 [Candidatus Lokiarchaeia archaeon]
MGSPEHESSGFKMFKAPYELPDVQAVVGAQIVGIREQEKLYGPAYTTRLIKYALQFEAQRIGEEPTEDINTLDQLTEYIVSKTDKYPTPNCVVMCAQLKAENDFQGQTGAATRVGEMGFHREFVQSTIGGEMNVDLDEVISNLVHTAFEMKLGPKEFGYRTNQDKSIDLLFPNCYYKDGCRQALYEGLLNRPDGRMQCSIGSTMCQYLKLVTGFEWDYDCLEFDEPHCIARCYKF